MKYANIGKYQRIQDLFYNKRDKVKEFTCEICGQQLSCLHQSHFQKHGISKIEYLQKYGFPNEFYERDYILNIIIDKFKDLYVIPGIKKWIKLDGHMRQYYTLQPETVFSERETDEKTGELSEKEEERKRRSLVFHDGRIRDHLIGKNTVGVFSLEKYSKFLVFDIDCYGEMAEGKRAAKAIKEFLTGYFPKNQVHIVFSGKKGYHIELFFSSLIKIEALAKLFSIVLTVINIEQYSKVNVEMRPELSGINGRGIKMACGVNFTNRDDYNNYACFMTDDFEPVEDEIQYVLGIQQSQAEIVYRILEGHEEDDVTDYGNGYAAKIEEQKEDRVPIVEVARLNNEDCQCSNITKLMGQGLTECGTRHKASFIIAMHLKEQGYSADEAYEYLLNWSIEQVKNGFSKSSADEIERDLKSILYRGIYSPKKQYNLRRGKNMARFAREEMEPFERLNSMGIKTGRTMVNYQKILFALLIHGKRYADKDGNFYMTYEQISNMSGVISPNLISQTITELHNLNMIIITSNKATNDTDDGKRPNQYRLVKVGTSENIDAGAYTICGRNKLCEGCYYNMIRHLYSDDELKKITTRGIKSKVLSNSVECNVNNHI